MWRSLIGGTCHYWALWSLVLFDLVWRLDPTWIILRGRRQIAKPRKYCLVRMIVFFFFGVCFLYFLFLTGWEFGLIPYSHSLIGGVLRLLLQDTWHRLIGWDVLIFKVTHVSTRLDCLYNCFHAPVYDWHFACFLCFYFSNIWQIFVGLWMVIVETSSSM